MNLPTLVAVQQISLYNFYLQHPCRIVHRLGHNSVIRAALGIIKFYDQLHQLLKMRDYHFNKFLAFGNYSGVGMLILSSLPVLVTYTATVALVHNYIDLAVALVHNSMTPAVTLLHN